MLVTMQCHTKYGSVPVHERVLMHNVYNPHVHYTMEEDYTALAGCKQLKLGDLISVCVHTCILIVFAGSGLPLIYHKREVEKEDLIPIPIAFTLAGDLPLIALTRSDPPLILLAGSSVNAVKIING